MQAPAIIQSFDLGQPLGQCRAAPVNLGPGQPAAFMVAYAADTDVDPFPEMFFFPQDHLKLAVFTVEGDLVWKKDLGKGAVPGMWFTPFLPADLDQDGVDEIYFVDNTKPDHPLSHSGRVLRRLDALTGEPTGQIPWPKHLSRDWLNYAFRFFLLAGRTGDGPVLVTAQGTYGDMFLQGWNADLSPRWQIEIPASVRGARGSHMSPVVDWDGDGEDEFLWGERLIRFKDGAEVFCADRILYDGHSDIIQPVLNADGETWSLYTCRESTEYNHNYPNLVRPPISPRVVLYDSKGERVWSALDYGHMDMGWIARIGPDRQPVAGAVRIGRKMHGPDGRSYSGVEEFFFGGLTGESIEAPAPAYRTIPVDLDGDGRHEFVRATAGSDGAVFMAGGVIAGNVQGAVSMASKFTAHPGEQLLTFTPEGRLHIWAVNDAADSAEAINRYSHPFYQANRKLTATGSNLVNLGGI